MARTRPNAPPATIASPTFKVPRCTKTVATGPRPLSKLASIATPRAIPSATARKSIAASAVSKMASINSSIPLPESAETLTNIVCPPYSSAIKLYSVNC